MVVNRGARSFAVGLALACQVGVAAAQQQRNSLVGSFDGPGATVNESDGSGTAGDGTGDETGVVPGPAPSGLIAAVDTPAVLAALQAYGLPGDEHPDGYVVSRLDGFPFVVQREFCNSDGPHARGSRPGVGVADGPRSGILTRG